MEKRIRRYRRAAALLSVLLCAAISIPHTIPVRADGYEAYEEEESRDFDDLENETAETEEEGQEETPEENDMEQPSTEEEENAENGEKTEEEAPEEDLEEESAENDESEAGEDEPGDAMPEEQEDMEETETADISLLALGIETAMEAGETSTYTDENGVSFTYEVRENGTAAITGVADYRGKDMVLPARIETYTVTRMECSVTSGSNLASLSIPETVEYVGDSAFGGVKINGDAVVSAGEIGSSAFQAATFQKLTLTDKVREIGANAFKNAKIQELHYDTEASHGGTGSAESAFYGAGIYALDFGQSVGEVPDFAFNRAKFYFYDLTLCMERIGDNAFSWVWPTYGSASGNVTLTDGVTYIGSNAFSDNLIGTLSYNANAESGAVAARSGSFYSAQIESIAIGSNVTAIPDYMFCQAKITQETLELNVERIGDCAFYLDTAVTDLTIGEKVKDIGVNAFWSSKITNLRYDAANATVGGGRSISTGDGPFWGVSFSGIAFGGKVERIPNCLFSYAVFSLESVTLPSRLKSIGAYAFYSYTEGGISMGELTIGKNVESIGERTFFNDKIEKVTVNALAADAAFKAMPVASTDAPCCTAVEIHRGSDFYGYFTKKTAAENITLMCESFETTQGEEYFDAERKCFITPYTESCTVCGYGTEGEATEEAFLVTFLDHDGTRLDRRPVKRGGAASAPEEPSRTGYRFTGWDKAFGNITADTTVTAQYEILKFTVTFKDGDTVLKTEQVEYGKDAVTPENPSRPEEEWGVWKFTGWSGNYRGITQDETVEAVFEKVLNRYTVIFYGADGKVLKTQTVPHGQAAQAPGAPEKQATAQYEYTFSGWDADFSEVTGDLEIHPQYTRKMRSYTVTFLDADGGVLKRESVEYGSSAAAPETPEKASTAQYEYIFTGWDKDTTSISADITVRPVYEAKIRSYKVTFADGESVLKEQTVDYGGDATPPEASRPDEEWGVWKFTGWSGNYRGITQNETVAAVFEKVLNRYTVIFYDADGDAINTQTVIHGEAAQAPGVPEKQATAQYEYTFSGWDADFSEVRADLEVYPQYTSKVRSYTVTFLDASGGVLKSESVEYGSGVTVPDAPGKASTAQYEYIFTGWDKDTTSIFADTAVRPVYEARIRSYKVTFTDGESVLKEQTVDYGGDATPPEASRPEEEWGVWRFVEWVGNFLGITRNETVRAVFEKVLNRYAVTFLDGEGKTLTTQFVEYGSAASAPETPPEKAATLELEYTFTGWDADFDSIKESKVLRPVYESRTRCYAVVFLDADGKILSAQSVEYGSSAVCPDAPEKEEDAWNTYSFTAWDGSFADVKSDLTIRPQYAAERKIYTVIFKDGDKILSVQNVEAGSGAVPPADPVRPKESWGRWRFVGWDGDYGCVLKETTITAKFERQENQAENGGASAGTGGDNPSADTGSWKASETVPSDAKADEALTDREAEVGDKPSTIETDDETAPGEEVSEKAETMPEDGADARPHMEEPSADGRPTDLEIVPEAGEKEEDADTDKKAGEETVVSAERTSETEPQWAEPEQEETENAISENDRSGKGFLAFCLAMLGMVLAAIMTIVYHVATRYSIPLVCRKDICGSVADGDGMPIAGLKIRLSRIDAIPSDKKRGRKSVWETITDENGHYCFKKLGKGSYWMSFPKMPGGEVSTVYLRLKKGTGDAFETSAAGCRAEVGKEGESYTVDITV